MPMPHIGEKIGISPLAEQHIDRAGQAYKGRAEEGRKEGERYWQVREEED